MAPAQFRLLFMGREINLDGVETSILKALGFGGGEITGKVVVDRVSGLELAEIIESMTGLIALGYVSSDKYAFYNREDFEAACFQINSGYSRDLKEALDPAPRNAGKSKRIRRE
jgi:uncharacterized membrane protein YebE (DUF533 family)